MSTEETVSRSPLDKPLHLLTEEDITQLTREDCRRYLKEKGMRRPSWNKSQAIQQVICLKTLLETTPDSDAGARRKLHIPRPENLHHRVPKSTSVNASICVPAEESVLCRRKDGEKHELSGDRLLADGNDSIPPRTAGATNSPLGQMTIFYCGKVNVYDDVPADKAQSLMQLAASPLEVPLEVPFDAATARRPLPCQFSAASVKVGSDSPVVILPASQAGTVTDNCWPNREESGICHEENTAAEVPGSRKASVQRYLEKRKDRFKSKRKVATPSSASLDVYLHPQMGIQTQNERPNRSDACSSPQIRPPHTPTRSGSAENNVVKNANFSAVLNDEDMQE